MISIIDHFLLKIVRITLKLKDGNKEQEPGRMVSLGISSQSVIRTSGGSHRWWMQLHMMSQKCSPFSPLHFHGGSW